MKKAIAILALIMATVSCSNAQQKTAFSNEALEGKLTTVEGTEITFKEVLEKYKGKTVLIEVWASWCSDCVKAMPKVKELQINNPDVVYIFISMDKAMDKWKTGIEKHDLKGNHFWVNDEKGMKGAFGKAIDLDWIPRYIVLNKEGKVALYRAIETDFEKINKELNQ